jgi:class 3 adenylate cyclase
LTAMLIAVSIGSLLLVGVVNYAVARTQVFAGVRDQLANHEAGQLRAIRNGLDRIKGSIATVARDRGTVESLGAFAAAYRDLDVQPVALNPEQRDELSSFYDGAATTSDVGGDLSTPEEPAGQYLQYHYIVANPFPPNDRAALDVAPDDTSTYATVHAERHPPLVDLRTTFGLDDLLLIDARGNVVYTTNKRADFARNIEDAALRETALAATVTEGLAGAAVNETVFVDFEPYPPAGGRPVMFAAATVTDGVEVIGAVVAEIPGAALNQLTTNNQSWRSEGLGDTGEVYIVGSDRRMRSDARLWLEDPEAYVEALDRAGYVPAVADAVVAADGTAGVQPASTEAVDEAFEGRTFVGRTRNYLDTPTLTAAGPLGIGGLDWVVVADLDVAEADSVLQSMHRWLFATLIVLLPLLVVAGRLLATRVTRAVEPVVSGAATIADGDLDTHIPDLGRTEVADVGRRLMALTTDLRAERAARVAQEHELTALLRSVLPARLAEQVQAGRVDIAELNDSATVVALTVTGLFEHTGISHADAVALSARLSRDLEAAAERVGVERVRSASDHHLFAAGLGSPDVAAETAAAFALEVVDVIARVEQESGVDVSCHAGMAAGEVVAGIVHPDTLTYGVFGEPVRIALALAAVAGDGQVLVDTTVASALDGWTLERPSGLVDLRGATVDAMLLIGGRERVSDPA